MEAEKQASFEGSAEGDKTPGGFYWCEWELDLALKVCSAAHPKDNCGLQLQKISS